MSRDTSAFGSEPTTIALPQLRIQNRQDGLEVLAKPAVRLHLPRELPRVDTVDGLMNAVEKKSLWLARTGSCHLEVSVVINDDPVLDSDRVKQVADTIRRHQVGISRLLDVVIR